MARALLALMLLALSLPAYLADCPDKSIACRIPQAEEKLQVSSNGCSGGASGTAGWSGAPYGSVTIEGKCFTAYQESNKNIYVPLGGATIGTCYQYRFGDFRWEDSCRPCGGKTVEDACEQKIKECTVCSTGCVKQYKVQSGDNCWGIAQANGISLSRLQEMNPGLKCMPLEVGVEMCVAQGNTSCRRVCEGKYV